MGSGSRSTSTRTESTPSSTKSSPSSNSGDSSTTATRAPRSATTLEPTSSTDATRACTPPDRSCGILAVSQNGQPGDRVAIDAHHVEAPESHKRLNGTRRSACRGRRERPFWLRRRRPRSGESRAPITGPIGHERPSTAPEIRRYQSCEARPTHSAGRPGRFRGEISAGWPRLVLVVRVGAVGGQAVRRRVGSLVSSLNSWMVSGLMVPSGSMPWSGSARTSRSSRQIRSIIGRDPDAAAARMRSR